MKRFLQTAAFAALVCLACACMPASAFATCNLGDVSVTMQSSVSVDSGGEAQVSVACNPPYSDQYPNCMNDYCPSGCDFGMEDSSGTGCQDKSNGQCTCFGYSISRYYPTCTVASSNPAVALATWADGVLSVRGYRPGTATLTVKPVLRLFTGLPGTIQVTVNEVASPEPAQEESAAAPEPAPATPAVSEPAASSASAAPAAQGDSKPQQAQQAEPAPAAPAADDSAAAAPFGEVAPEQPAATEQPAASEAPAAPAGQTASEPAAQPAPASEEPSKSSAPARASSARSVKADAPDPSSEDPSAPATASPVAEEVSASPVAEVAQEPGMQSVLSVISQAEEGDGAAEDSAASSEGVLSSEAVYHLGDEGLDVASLLRDAAGTESVLTFWAGADVEAPDYVIEAPAMKMSADSDFDVTFIAQAVAPEDLKGLAQGSDFVAFRIDEGKAFPATVQMLWRLAGAFANGSMVNVYRMGQDGAQPELVHANVPVGEGYACFNLAEGGLYVVSDDAAFGMAATPGASDSGEAGSQQAEAPAFIDVPAWAVLLCLAVVAAAACALFVTLRARRASGKAAEEGAPAVMAAPMAGDEQHA